MDVKEIGINTRNFVDPTQDRDYWRALVHAALNLQVSLGYLVRVYYMYVLHLQQFKPNLEQILLATRGKTPLVPLMEEWEGLTSKVNRKLTILMSNS